MPTGICHICGKVKPLSFEHIPPRAAFNSRLVITVPLEQAIRLGPVERPKGRIKQKGVGDYVLCNARNNNTGSWYASRFVDWCYRGMEILTLSNGAPNLVYIYKTYPLSVLKQIVVMFLAINNPGVSKANPDLTAFVQEREKTPAYCRGIRSILITTSLVCTETLDSSDKFPFRQEKGA